MTRFSVLLQIQNETTLKSKLQADRRNMDLQRRHDALKEDQQLTQRALTASQVPVLLSSSSSIIASLPIRFHDPAG